jgi:hypothetical protein
MKYLGFSLKENNYRKKYWQWLCAKVEKCLLSWHNRWLSCARRLVLVKSVLEAIPVSRPLWPGSQRAFLRESTNSPFTSSGWDLMKKYP